jgi:hypothetical protein
MFALNLSSELACRPIGSSRRPRFACSVLQRSLSHRTLATQNPHRPASPVSPSRFPWPPRHASDAPKNSWWPAKSALVPKDFVDDTVCSTCHAQKTVSQVATPMARAASRVSGAKVPRDNPSMTATRGKFAYAISQTAQGFDYSVSDGANRISATLLWAFGIANKRQTYIYEKGGEFYQSEMSYYPAIAGLDVTTGHEQKRRQPARTLWERSGSAGRAKMLPAIPPEPPRSAAGSLRKMLRLALLVKPAMGRAARMSS